MDSVDLTCFTQASSHLSGHLPIAALVAAFAAGPAWAQNTQIADLGVLNGGSTSVAFGVSADGSVAVGWAAEGGATANNRAFRWTEAESMKSLGTLNGGSFSVALGVSADGSTVVGWTDDGAVYGFQRAFRWTHASGMQDLGVLKGGGASAANATSADGSVVVGWSTNDEPGKYQLAFRWTQSEGMQSLGSLNGGWSSGANGVSADGRVVVGVSADGAAANNLRAFHWTEAEGMKSLGVLNGGDNSAANGLSADGSVVVGWANDGAANQAFRAFRWTAATGMQNLGVLNGGLSSQAMGVSGDGQVVVGTADDGATGLAQIHRAFRWTQAGGMQKLEDWLRANGVKVPVDITYQANATNSDGSVVVGELENHHAFLARVAASGTGTGTGTSNGLITLDDVAQSLAAANIGSGMTLRIADLMINGAHSRPLDRRVAPGQKTFWVAGDGGRDDHGERDGPFGLAEVGGGYRFGPVQLNLALGQTWAKQSMTMNGRVQAEGSYALIETLLPLAAESGLWATLGAHYHRGEADIRRAYVNAGLPDISRGKPDTETLGVRARLDWENAARAGFATFSPYADLSYAKLRQEGYTESTGGFPAHFDARHESTTELRLGINASHPLASGSIRLLGALEGVHRLERRSARTSGQMIGLFSFDLDGQTYDRDWLRVGAGIEGKVGDGSAALTLNATSQGEVPNLWLSASYQLPF